MQMDAVEGSPRDGKVMVFAPPLSDCGPQNCGMEGV